MASAIIGTIASIGVTGVTLIVIRAALGATAGHFFRKLWKRRDDRRTPHA